MSYDPTMTTPTRKAWVTGAEALEEFGLGHNQLYEYHRDGCCHLGGKRLRARRKTAATAHGHLRSDLWQFDRAQVERIARGSDNDEALRQQYQDNDGTWLPAAVASRRHKITIQHLERWRDRPCRLLGGRTINAKEVPAATRTGTLWVYQESDLQRIARGRRSPPDGVFADSEGTWLFAGEVQRRYGIRANNLWHYRKKSYPFLPKRKIRAKKVSGSKHPCPQTGRKLFWVYLESDLEAIKTQDTIQERQHERGPVPPDGARAEPVRGAAQRTVATRGQPGESAEDGPVLKDRGFPTYQTRPVEVIVIDVQGAAANKLGQQGAREEPSAPAERGAFPERTKRPDYLASWQEILEALDQKNNEAMRGKVRRINETFHGPIVFPGQGAQPQVERGALTAWWDELEEEFNAQKSHERDEEATTETRYNHNGRRERSEEVVPEIDGHVKERRQGRGRSK
jgi:hypothetical protein